MGAQVNPCPKALGQQTRWPPSLCICLLVNPFVRRLERKGGRQRNWRAGVKAMACHVAQCLNAPGTAGVVWVSQAPLGPQDTTTRIRDRPRSLPRITEEYPQVPTWTHQLSNTATSLGPWIDITEKTQEGNGSCLQDVLKPGALN